MVSELGLIQIYTGDGKGKTTAAVGLLVRAAGQGLRCQIIHFMKSEIVSGEDKTLSAIKNVTVMTIGSNLISGKNQNLEEVRTSLKLALLESKKAVSGEYDLVVLDEIIVASSLGLIPESEIFEIAKIKAEATELILTGRGATDSLIEMADLVTEMREIKHPFATGVEARRGIEF